MKLLLVALFFGSLNTWGKVPERFDDLLKYVQAAPDQGETNTCLFVSSTGAIELLLNQKYNVVNPTKGDRFDLSERFTISYGGKNAEKGYWHTAAISKFNDGWSIHENELPFFAKTPEGEINYEVWNMPENFYKLPRVSIKEQFTTQTLFVRGGKWATYVLKEGDIGAIKYALAKYKAPILVNYNDEGWWHMILIVGYDDHLTGECYFTPAEECSGKGAFYVRDSNGQHYEARDYDWFRVNGNAAFVVKMK